MSDGEQGVQQQGGAGQLGDQRARGLAAVVGSEDFHVSDVVGGWRGTIESLAPGVIFVVVFVASGQRLLPPLIGASATAVLMVLARLVQRQSPTQAFSGVLGVGIGVIWAWRTGEASNYFAWGLWVNAVWLVGTLLTIIVRLPLVGLVAGLLASDGPLGGGSWSAVIAWRSDRRRLAVYSLATWFWVAMFGLRLVVQLPLYYADQVGWLGTAKLVMGVPLTAVAAWLSWRAVRQLSPASSAQPRQHPDR